MIEIRTKDVDEAAFFWLQNGAELSNVDVKYGFRRKVVWLVFKMPLTEEEFNRLLNDYRNGKTLVEPKAYAEKRGDVSGIIKTKILN